MPGWMQKLFGFSAGTALVAVTAPYLKPYLPATILADLSVVNLDLPSFSILQRPPSPPPQPEPFVCRSQNYTTSIISLEPLVIYIHSFLSQSDIGALLNASDGLFKPSHVTKYGRTVAHSERTSTSAALPLVEPVVQCVLGRARDFMGTMYAPGRDAMGPPQLVRYTTGQKFNTHHDWFLQWQRSYEDRERYWNRVASFFAVLEDGCEGGETHFPYLEPAAPQHQDTEPRQWRKHEDGGVAFKPVAGNALFWVNLHANGTGDLRTRHAGLPLVSGLKTAMNIWPRVYKGPEAWDKPVEKTEDA